MEGLHIAYNLFSERIECRLVEAHPGTIKFVDTQGSRGITNFPRQFDVSLFQVWRRHAQLLLRPTIALL